MDCRESGQLAIQQEVRRLIRQREPPLGQRSQRSVGTWLDPLCALGTLEDSVHQAAVDLSSVDTVWQSVILSSTPILKTPYIDTMWLNFVLNSDVVLMLV